MMVENSKQVKPDKIYSVTEITRLVKIELETAFPSLWIEGEISDFKRAHSGHLYFTLKDEKSQIRTVMWRSQAQKIAFELENGLQVISRGAINVYEPRGQYQFIADVVEPKGKGALQLAFEQLWEKLKKEGLFDKEIKKNLPLLPKKIGVVTSPKGAAIADILRILERRFARLHVVLFPARVQGKGASDEIVEGIGYFSRLSDVDVLIVGRGGGSMEDLWAFNEEKVARAIFQCPIPVISAVGHEIDITISDFVADIRASTPSAAAEMVIEKEQSFLEKIDSFSKSLEYHIKYSLQSRNQEVLHLVHHQAFQNFKSRLHESAQNVDDLDIRAREAIRDLQQRILAVQAQAVIQAERMKSSFKRYLQSLQGKWERFSAELHSLSPLNILKKGYALCWKNGKRYLVRKVEDLEVEDEVTVSFFKGEFACLVKKIDGNKTIEDLVAEDK
jgi:exodeoxyribonuclease VII large subunit